MNNMLWNMLLLIGRKIENESLVSSSNIGNNSNVNLPLVSFNQIHFRQNMKCNKQN